MESNPETLIGAITGREWPIVASLVAMLIAAFAGDVVVRAGVTGTWLQIVSVARAYVAGAGAAVIAGAVWWQALIAASMAPIVSAGARDLAVEAVRWLLRRGTPTPSATSSGQRPPLADPEATSPATPLPRPRGSAGPLAGLFLLMALSGCATPCLAERGIVNALSAGISAAGMAIPDDAGEDAVLAVEAGRGAALMGDALVSGCEAVRDSEGWQAWVGLALEAATGLAAIFGAAGPDDVPADPPPALMVAVEQLRAEAYRPEYLE